MRRTVRLLRYRRAPTARRARAAVALAGVLAACTGGGDDAAAPTTATNATVVSTTTTLLRTTTDPLARCRDTPDVCTLRETAKAAGMRVGVAAGTAQLANPAVADLIAREFDQLTPENEMKWSEIEPNPGQYEFARADQLVDYAEQRGLDVRGHTLVWGQRAGNGAPAWVREIGGADALIAELSRHVTVVVSRYRGRVARWDVVNEPLGYPVTAVDSNRFADLLGSTYIDVAFRAARAADPDAELWLNEIDAEVYTERGDALVALVEQLLGRGVPLDGVGLQSHLVSGAAPPAGQLERLVRRLKAKGVKVAITELDIPVVPTEGVAGLSRQAEAYGQVFRECIAAGCDEVTLWGVSDADTWLDAQLDRRTQPLLFDESLAPKPAYDAVREVLARA